MEDQNLPNETNKESVAGEVVQPENDSVNTPVTPSPSPDQQIPTESAAQTQPAQPATQAPSEQTSSAQATLPMQPPVPEPQYAPPAQQPIQNPASYAPPVQNISPTPALVLGILAIVFSGIPIAGIVLGILAIVQAGKYFRAGGTEGTAKGGKICGIIGICFSVIMIIVTCIFVVIGVMAIDEYDSRSQTSTITSSPSAGTSSSVDADEQAVFDVVNPYLDQIKNKDPQMVARIAKIMEDSFNEAMADSDLDTTLQGCGVDPNQLALLMIEGFDYSEDYVYDDDDEAEANYDITVRSISDVAYEFYEQVMDLARSSSAGSMTLDEAYTLIGEKLINAVESTPAEETAYYFDVDVKLVNGNWVMDEESFNDELDYFFALY